MNPDRRLRVTCLCARWCGTCEAYRTTFRAVAKRHPGIDFSWIDVEDEADALGDPPDVSNFPTLMISVADRVDFLGAVRPHSATLERLVAQAAAGDPPQGVEAGIVDDPAALARAVEAWAARGAAGSPEHHDLA
jgi:thiol-disulfide isomerase/thioredoxin